MSDDPFPGSSADFYERLMTTEEKLNQANALLREKDAQIAKLISSKGAQGQSAETAGYFYHVILRQKSLIIELSDALETTTDLLNGYGHYVKHGTDLVQRAREATK